MWSSYHHKHKRTEVTKHKLTLRVAVLCWTFSLTSTRNRTSYYLMDSHRILEWNPSTTKGNHTFYDIYYLHGLARYYTTTRNFRRKLRKDWWDRGGDDIIFKELEHIAGRTHWMWIPKSRRKKKLNVSKSEGPKPIGELIRQFEICCCERGS